MLIFDKNKLGKLAVGQVKTLRNYCLFCWDF